MQTPPPCISRYIIIPLSVFILMVAAPLSLDLILESFVTNTHFNVIVLL